MKIPFAWIKVSILFLILICTSHYHVKGQSEKKVNFKDSLDGKLDASDFLINANGFIPIPQLITEPSLGYFGMVLAPVFIQPNKYAKEGQRVSPNITAAFAGYTANNSWMLGAMRIAHLPQYGLKYRIGGGYSSLNLDFYRELEMLGEQRFEFNIRAVPLFGSLTKQVGKSGLFLGLEYLYMSTDVSPEFVFVELPDFLKDQDFKSVISSPGILAEYDRRDNVFTPNKGLFFSTDFRVNADWTGSDYDYQSFSIRLLQYIQTTDRWVSGFRIDGKMVFGDAPFFLMPAINLRGVPRSRYQGAQSFLFETEQRYDFNLRWSGVLFAGTAKAIPSESDFSSADWVYNYGAGFRYLLARKFGLRMGVDVAGSNSDFGYYIVFGSAW